MIRYFYYDLKSLFWVRFSAYFFTFKLETVDFFTINPVIWSRLFLVKIIPHIHHPRLQRVFRPSLSLLRREERAGSLLIKKRRTSSLRGAYAYLIINHHEGFISWWFCCIPTVFYKHCWQPYFIYDNFNLSEKLVVAVDGEYGV